jgi:hypothetical protein
MNNHIIKLTGLKICQASSIPVTAIFEGFEKKTTEALIGMSKIEYIVSPAHIIKLSQN